MLNAANEIAVGAFLGRRLAFTDIAAVIDRVLMRSPAVAARSLEDVLNADEWARREAQAVVADAAGVVT